MGALIPCDPVVGNGVDIDVAQAIFWYRRAAEVGHEFAELQLKCLLEGDDLPGDLDEVTGKLDEEMDALEANPIPVDDGDEDEFWGE